MNTGLLLNYLPLTDSHPHWLYKGDEDGRAPMKFKIKYNKDERMQSLTSSAECAMEPKTI